MQPCSFWSAIIADLKRWNNPVNKDIQHTADIVALGSCQSSEMSFLTCVTPVEENKKMKLYNHITDLKDVAGN